MNRGKRIEINPVDDACDIRIIGVDIAKPKRNIFKKLFDKWNIIDYCPKCGCKETRSIVKDTINHTVCEEEIRCAKCDYLLDYWAYGKSSRINKRTDQLNYIWSGTVKTSRRGFFNTGKIDIIELIKNIISNIKWSLYYIFNAEILVV